MTAYAAGYHAFSACFMGSRGEGVALVKDRVSETAPQLFVSPGDKLETLKLIGFDGLTALTRKPQTNAMQEDEQIIVIGAGAGGMMAAGRAAELGACVLLLEKMERPGKKILISGNGGCNLSNTRDVDGFMEQFGSNGLFLGNAFSRFFREDLLQFLRRYGIEIKTKPNGKIYPLSDNAKDIVRAFKQYLEEGHVQLQTGTGVDAIIIENQRVVGVETASRIIPAAAVVLAAGGASHPVTGSTGDGYRLAGGMGHMIVPLRPGLVPLRVTQVELAQSLQGMDLRGVSLTAFQGTSESIDASLIPAVDVGRGIAGEPAQPPIIEHRTGDAVIIHFGISGPMVYEMSLAIVDALAKGPVSVCFDLKPGLSEAQLRTALHKACERPDKWKYKSVVRSLLPRRIVDRFVMLTAIPPEKLGYMLTLEEKERVIRLMKSLRFDIQGPHSMATAMVTAGGVALSEIDPQTMASKLISGLYFCGEVMDLDAATGGYNLQAAFSTGYVAGEEAVAFLRRGH